MTFRKNLTLNNVLYEPKIHKNLVFGSLLNKHGFRLVFKFNKVILPKYEMSKGEDYVANGLLKLNVKKA